MTNVVGSMEYAYDQPDSVGFDWEHDVTSNLNDDDKPCDYNLKGEPMKALDTQVGGTHYKDMVIQPLEYIMANNMPYCEANVVKYISRWKSKGGVEDLRKVKHYVDLLIDSAEDTTLDSLLEPQYSKEAIEGNY